MLNIEKYKDEIKEIGVGGFTVSKNGELKRCVNIPCDSCAFCLNYGGGGCGKKKIDWLCEEYKEPEINWDEDIDWMRVPVDTKVLVRG